MIRVSLAVACPMVFILLCDLGQHREVFKLMKIGQFEIFSAVVVRILKIFSRSRRKSYCEYVLWLRAQWSLFRFVIKFFRGSAQTWRLLNFKILKALGSLSPIFWADQGVTYIILAWKGKSVNVVACPIVFILLWDKGRQGRVLKLMECSKLSIFSRLGPFVQLFGQVKG